MGIKLFLQLACLSGSAGFALRDDMAMQAIKFRKALDKPTGDHVDYAISGDLHTMALMMLIITMRLPLCKILIVVLQWDLRLDG